MKVKTVKRITIRLVRRCFVPLESLLCFFCANRASVEDEDGVRMCSNCCKVYKEDMMFGHARGF